jgi:hypothetical protein
MQKKMSSAENTEWLLVKAVGKTKDAGARMPAWGQTQMHAVTSRRLETSKESAPLFLR